MVGKGAVAALLVFAAMQSPAVAIESDLKVLRVCQDPNNMPFANLAQEGIENRIADVFAQKLSVGVEYFSLPQRLAFVRNSIRFRLPGENYRCDVLLGVPKRFGQVARTETYYRSTYALVYRRGSALAGVTNGEEFLKRAATDLPDKSLGIHDRGPASAWLAKHQLTHLAALTATMNADPTAYPGRMIEKDMAEGRIEAAILWGPVAGYFAKKLKDLDLVVVPLRSEPQVKFDYAMAMGVRYGEPQWRNTIQQLINSSRAELTQILVNFGVPLVDELGEPLSEKAIAQMTKGAKLPPTPEKPSPERNPNALLKSEPNARATPRAEKLAQEKADQQAVAKNKAMQAQKASKQVEDKPTQQASSAVVAAVANPPKVKPTAGATAAALYTVKDGYFVDEQTYEGFKTWRAAACDRCHGANQQGLVGPSLIESLKTLTKEEFVITVRDGRLSKGMQSFGNHKKVMKNMDHLYAYLKGRSDGAITRAKVKRIDK